jgi:TatD DNase family protein
LHINLLSHFSQKGSEWVLQSFYKDFENLDFNQHFSAGLHPWHIQNGYLHEFEKLERLGHSKNMLAVGECGLDKVCNTDFKLQVAAFERQVSLANEIKKPLIIHCVRAYDEVLELLEIIKNKMPVVFHGFNKSKELALRLTGKGYYLSFGASIQKSSVNQYLAGLPLSHICFETDDADASIESIYSIASESLKISTDELISQVQKNVENILSIKL